MSQPSVLVVEDNDLERQITVETLREEGFLVDEAPNGKRAMEQLALGSFDVVLTDLLMPGMTGEELLAAVRQTYPGSQVVLLTAHGTIESAVKATKSGAFEYLTKPTDREKLVMTVGKAAEFASLTQENILLRTRLEGKFQIEGIIGQHPAIEDVIRVVRKVAPSYSTVLIQGESGTGKEVIARAIHKLSPRGTRLFVAINCSAIPDSLIENELFGHERGAFTGANERKIGLIESADKSTLFLDEIADLNIGLQAETSARPAGTRAAARRQQRIDPGRRAPGRRHQPRSVRGSRPGALSRGPLLPHQRRHHHAAAAARSPLGHPAAGGKRAQEPFRPLGAKPGQGDQPRSDGGAARLSVAGQRAPARIGDRARALLCEGDRIMPKDLPQEVLARKMPARTAERARGERFEIPAEGINFENLERDLILQAMERGNG